MVALCPTLRPESNILYAQQRIFIGSKQTPFYRLNSLAAMKPIYVWLALFAFPGLLLQAQSPDALRDDFSDGNFSVNPAWTGDTASFMVSDGWLQSNGPAASSTLYLATPQIARTEVEWRIRVRLDFDPSSSNYVRIYLVSDRENLTDDVSGYYLQIGESGATTSDSIDLFRSDGGTSVALLTSSFPCIRSASSNVMDLRVLCGADGLWSLSADCAGGGEYEPGGTVTDTQHPISGWFGVYARYTTASRSDGYFFDEIYAGPIIVDSVAPHLESLHVRGPDQLELRFSEAVQDSSSQDVSRYHASNGLGNPLLAVRGEEDPTLVQLHFGADFPSGEQTELRVGGVGDLAGNLLPDTTVSFDYYAIQPYDLIITEFMADATPSGGILPEAEFVEILNRSGQVLSLEGLTLRDGSASGVAAFPAISMPPGQMIILCEAADTMLFAPFGRVVGLDDFPSLNNDEDLLEIRDIRSQTIHKIFYSTDWYGDQVKKEGGWSIEMIRTESPYLGPCNWSAATALAQGTPGFANSSGAFPVDSEAPLLLSVVPVDAATLMVVFSEALDSLSLLNVEQYQIEPEIGTPISASPQGPDFRSVALSLPDLLVHGVVYSLRTDGVSDCAGNVISQENNALFGLPETPDSLDIVINEILFDPKTGGKDYIELFNRSNKVIDPSMLYIIEGDLDNPGTIADEAQLPGSGGLIFPGQYWVFTEDPSAVLGQFFCPDPMAIVRTSDMPSWPDSDKEGLVALEYRDGSTVFRLDQVQYSQDWHYALIDDTEGVSLERIQPGEPSQQAQNWHSAAQARGFGTPGYRNSAYLEGIAAAPGLLSINPEVFSPDQDGVDDVLQIGYAFDQPGFTASLLVFNSQGRLVRTLLNSIALEARGAVNWDGIDDRGEKAPVGIYILWMEAFDLSGQVFRIKKRVVVAAKL